MVLERVWHGFHMACNLAFFSTRPLSVVQARFLQYKQTRILYGSMASRSENVTNNDVSATHSKTLQQKCMGFIVISSFGGGVLCDTSAPCICLISGPSILGW